ncbi:MAG TPA: KEOPS complex subunit Cgi121, partial [Nitrososphaera sp.]|nr:KEOPS complex subunit Cgi121 [Nitrososphaera sp.]
PAQLLQRLRADYNQPIISIQAVNAVSVYGIDHVMGILLITLEAEKRRVMIAKRSETELLLRLGLTDQIMEAIARVGLKKGNAGCLIGFSKDAKALKRFSDKMESEFRIDSSVLLPTREKKAKLTELFGIKTKFDDREFLQYLLERAAILVKS